MNRNALTIAAALVATLAAGHAADPLTLLPENAPAKFFVPSDDGLGTNWLAPGFNDTSWSSVVSGIGFDSPKAPILPTGTLADSVADFSGIQGEHGWTYGYYDKAADGDGIYQAATDFNEADPNFVFDGAWSLGAGDPPWTRITALGMQPNSAPEHWPIRRYTSAYSGLVRIAGTLTLFQECGGGTRARIFVDGTQVFTKDLSQTSIGYSVLANVSVGSTIDFALDPNGDDSCDSTTWTALIQPAAISTMLAADSETEFNGAGGQTYQWVSKTTGGITVDWHFSKSSVGSGSLLRVLLNGQQMDSASIAGDDLMGVLHVLPLQVRQGDVVEFVQTPATPGCLFNAHIFSHSYNPEAICTLVADSQTDWSPIGQQGFRGWSYGYYNKTADHTPGYQADDFRLFPHDGGGWSSTDFWDGNLWNWNPDPVPWDILGQTLTIPNGTNSLLSEEHWVIRRWASTAQGTLRVDWFTRKVNPFGNGVTGKIFHNGIEKDSAATTTLTGFQRSLSFSGVAVGDFIDLPLTPVGPGSDGDDGADGSDNGMTLYSCTNVIDAVKTDIGSLMQNTNASGYLRLRFDVADVSCLDQVRLRMRYDDGFVAWLNGVEIARRNAPATPDPAWNANATVARSTAEAMAPEVIDVTAFKSALVTGGNVLAIHGLNRSIDDSDFLISPEITATVLPPDVIADPSSRTNQLGDTALFQVAVHTCAAVNYQWRSNGVPISGETTDQLFIGAQLENQAGYDVVISNAGGSITSLVAILTVNRDPVALNHGVATPIDTAVLVPGRKLLNDATDPDGDPFQLVSIGTPAQGTASLSGGDVNYVPPTGFTGSDTFTFTIADNRGGSATGMVSVFVYSGVLPSQNQVVIQTIPGGQRVRFAGVPGKGYQVQRATSLTSPMTWTPVQTLTAPTYGIMEYTDENNLPQAFYRTTPAP